MLSRATDAILDCAFIEKAIVFIDPKIWFPGRLLAPTVRPPTVIEQSVCTNYFYYWQDSAFGLFARKLEARTDNGELMNLIDDSGCPINELVFPALDLEKVRKH